MTKFGSAFLTLCVVVVVGLLAARPLGAQGSGPRVEISGTSTVRGWMCPVEADMSVMSGGGSAPAPGFPDGLQSISLTVKVADIECPEEQMKEHLREAMEASAHPEIVYELQQYTITGSTAEASGTISIHGVTKPITLEIQLVESPEGVRGIGETEIDMTEFGVTPPSLWGGLMNVGELVTIKFDALLSN